MRGRIEGPFCPLGGPTHGTPLHMPESGLYHCPHVEHDGRLPSHPDGPAPITRTFFTEAEAYGLEKEKTNGNQEDR